MTFTSLSENETEVTYQYILVSSIILFIEILMYFIDFESNLLTVILCSICKFPYCLQKAFRFRDYIRYFISFPCADTVDKYCGILLLQSSAPTFHAFNIRRIFNDIYTRKQHIHLHFSQLKKNSSFVDFNSPLSNN